MLISTFNANSLRARLPIILNWLTENKPDILAVQETKVQDKDFPTEPFEKIGYHCVFKGQKSYNGVAVISKTPALDVHFGFHESDDINAPRLIRCRIDSIYVINTYIPQGRSIDSEHYQLKLQWFRDLKKLFQTHYSPDQPIVWLGDMNVAPEPIDVYDPEALEGHVCFNKELSDVFRETCSWGFFDVFRRYHPAESGQFTFYDYRLRGGVSRNLGWRIDHILVTKPLLDRSISAYIDLSPRKSKDHKPSDHTFLVAEFD